MSGRSIRPATRSLFPVQDALDLHVGQVRKSTACCRARYGKLATLTLVWCRRQCPPKPLLDITGNKILHLQATERGLDLHLAEDLVGKIDGGSHGCILMRLCGE